MKHKLFILFILLNIGINMYSEEKFQFLRSESNVVSILNFDTLIVTIYYNQGGDFPLVGRSIDDIRRGQYEFKIVIPLSNISSKEEVERIFYKPFVRKIDRSLFSMYYYGVDTLCDFVDKDGNTVLWYTYDEQEQNEFMLINNILIKKDEGIINFTKKVIEENRPEVSEK